MQNEITDVYKGWTISVKPAKKLCANFSFTITSPTGHTQNVAMGGENRQRALERAREMIDMELAFAQQK